MNKTVASLITLPLLFIASAVCAQTATPSNGPQPDGSKMPTGAEFIAQIDTNKDGVADKTEAAANERFAADFDKVDADHDGKVTVDEITKFFATMAAPGK